MRGSSNHVSSRPWSPSSPALPRGQCRLRDAHFPANRISDREPGPTILETIFASNVSEYFTDPPGPPQRVIRSGGNLPDTGGYRSYRASAADREPLVNFMCKALEGACCRIIRASPADQAPFRINFETPSGIRQGIVAHAFLAVLAVKDCACSHACSRGRLINPVARRCAVGRRFRAFPPEQPEHDHVGTIPSRYAANGT